MVRRARCLPRESSRRSFVVFERAAILMTRKRLAKLSARGDQLLFSPFRAPSPH